MSETAARDYRSTLNLPKTEFPMRAELPKREPDRVRWWAEHDTYRRRLERNRANGGASFVLHDGPPYANGELHMGHVLNRVLKDTLVKIDLLDGEYSDFVPGWDMHGLADRARDAHAPQAGLPRRRPDRAAPCVPRARAVLARPPARRDAALGPRSAGSTIRT